MSKTQDRASVRDTPEQDDPAATINENRDLWERIADSDLPLSKPVQRALDQIDEDEDGETDA